MSSTHDVTAFQLAVREWMVACFGADDTDGVEIRAWRFLEEANELGQAAGVTREDAHRLVDYVYGRPVGEPLQEVGGVGITLMGLCSALNVSASEAFLFELGRVWLKLPQIRAKNAAKKADSALPGNTSAGVAPMNILRCVNCLGEPHMGPCHPANAP